MYVLRCRIVSRIRIQKRFLTPNISKSKGIQKFVMGYSTVSKMQDRYHIKNSGVLMVSCTKNAFSQYGLLSYPRNYTAIPK